MLAELRIPVSLPKLEGPSTTVTFLGIVLVQGPDQFLVIEAVWSLVRLGVFVGTPFSCSCGGQARAYFPPAPVLPTGKG